MSVRGIHTDVTDMREKIFTEVARLAYEGGDYSRLEELHIKLCRESWLAFVKVYLQRELLLENVLDLQLDCRTVHWLSMRQWQTV